MVFILRRGPGDQETGMVKVYMYGAGALTEVDGCGARKCSNLP